MSSIAPGAPAAPIILAPAAPRAPGPEGARAPAPATLSPRLPHAAPSVGWRTPLSEVRTQVLPVDLEALALQHVEVSPYQPGDDEPDDDRALSWLPQPRPQLTSPERLLRPPRLPAQATSRPIYSGLVQPTLPAGEAEMLRPNDRPHEAAFAYLNAPRRHGADQGPMLDPPSVGERIAWSTMGRLLLDAALPPDGAPTWHAAAPGRAERLGQMLATMTTLESLSVGRRGAEPRLREGLLRAVAGALPSWPDLYELNIDVLDVDAVGLRRLLAEGELCRALGGLQKLQVLRLRAGGPGARWPEQAEAAHARRPDVPGTLVAALGALGALRTLDLSGLELGGAPLAQLAGTLPQLQGLRRLSLTLLLRQGAQDAAALQTLAAALRACPRLNSARLRIINLPGGATGAGQEVDARAFAALAALAEAVPSSTEQPLQLAHPCWLTPAQAEQVGTWLGAWPQTEVLNLAPWRPSGAAAAATLAAHLGHTAARARHPVLLRELVLPASVGDGAALGAFAATAAALPGLEVLALGCLTLEPELAAVARPTITPAMRPAAAAPVAPAAAADDVVSALLQLVAAAPQLRELDLSRTRLTDEQLQRLNDALVARDAPGGTLALRLSPRACYRLSRVRPQAAPAWASSPSRLGLTGGQTAAYAPRLRPLPGRHG